MMLKSIFRFIRAGSLLFPAALISFHAVAQEPFQATPRVFAPENGPVKVAQAGEDSPSSVISLASTARLAQAQTAGKGAPASANLRANYHAFATARAGVDAGVEPLTLNFSGSTTITKLASTSKEFVLESGGTCAEGKSYSAGQSCTLLVRFNPQGAGNRLGSITVENSLEARAFQVGLTGNGYAPVLVFTPAAISTVASTYPSGAGLISNATRLAVDGGDTVYAADTGNNRIRKIDPSGALATVVPVFSTPVSIVVDSLGTIWTLNTSSDTYYLTNYRQTGSQTGWGYSYSAGACTSSSPCAFNTVGMGSPGDLSIDRSDNLFFREASKGAAEMPIASYTGGAALSLWYLNNAYAYSSSPVSTFAVDLSGNLYTAHYQSSQSVCNIYEEPLYSAQSTAIYKKVAGGLTCGFSGDGGQARSAGISSSIGQIAFDVAGNLYFADTGNQRVRRIDATTGIINTIAGNGTAGYTGDGTAAVYSSISYPTGVTVDSTGAVYILTGTGTSSGGAQVIRKVGPNGDRQLPNTYKGSTSSRVVTLSNVGNDGYTLVNALMTGANASDFAIDPATTTCPTTPGASLEYGQTCNLGIIFSPTGGGLRQADFVLLGNTVTGSNSIHLSGNGLLPQATVVINSPASGATITAGTTVTFKATVSSGSSPAPTGTVTFLWAGVSQGTVALSGGTAQVSVTPGTTGVRTLTATYNGDANYAAKSVSENVTVVSGSSQPVHIIQAPVEKPVRKTLQK